MTPAAQKTITQTAFAGFLMLCVCLACGCDTADSSAATVGRGSNKAAPQRTHLNGMSIIVVDSRHSMKENRRGNVPYVADAGKGIVVDPKSFRFDDPQDLGRTPNVLRVLYNKSQYEVDFRGGAELLTLDRRTLRTVSGDPFNGFEAGTPAIVGIGFEDAEPGSSGTKFREFWCASILFR